ncbi:MAG: sulfatase [Kiritimatiellae bacterium]|nr:sulfatase [Kiritimatiellia bacterium]
MDTSRRDFLVGAGAAALFTGMGGLNAFAAGGRSAELLKAAREKKINILYIMTDDHAAHAISAYGSRINKTPNIDRLADEGMIFSDVMCTNPICGPSRACILTGRYSHKNGVPSFVPISPEIKTVGGYMRDAGYYTGFLGKWHVGGPGTVRDSDWDKWMVYENQGSYFDPYFFVPGKNGKRFDRITYKGEYATENLTKVTIETIEEARAAGKPFFVMMHHKAPHRNWLPSPKYHHKFRALTLKDIPMPDTIFDKYDGRATPIKTTAMTLLNHMRPGPDLKLAEFFSEGHTFEFEGKTYTGRKNASGKFVNDWPEGMDDRARTALSYLRYMQDYLACVQSVDDSVGDMLDYLKKNGMEENTLVVYTSDQGFFLGDHGLYDKRFIMEETLKMPFLAKCPAFVPAKSVNRDIVTNADFAPTFIDLAGGAKPDCMQGDSFLRNLAGDTPVDWKDACYARYYVEGGEHQTAAWYGIRTKTEKLVFYYKRGEWEYFDMENDPEELHNLYGDPTKADRVEHLKKRLEDLRAQLQDDDKYADCHEYSL